MGILMPGGPKRLHKQKDVAALRAILNDTSRPGRDRRYAAYALGDIGDTAAVTDLIAVLPDLEVRGLAAEALGALGDLRAAGPLVLYAAGTQNPKVAASFRTAFNMLASADPTATKAATDAFDRQMRDAAARFGARCEEPVETLAACHLCDATFTTRLTHSVWCRPCNLCFSDAGWTPNVAKTGDDFGQLRSESVNPNSIMMNPSPMFASFGLTRRDEVRVGLVWHLIEDYSADSGCSLAVWGWFMKQAVPSIPRVADD
jgi:ribosomal protein L37AE/L43A